MNWVEQFLPGIGHVQNIHPLIVHFPIAFLMGALLLYFLAWMFRKDALAVCGFSLLILAAISAIAAAASGLYAEEGVMVSRSVRANLLVPHEMMMLITGGLSIVLAIWAIIARPFPKNGRVIFMLALVIAVAIMAKGADFGGRMVYDYNAGGDACPQPIEFTH